MSRSDRAARGAGSGAGADRLGTHVGFVVCSFRGAAYMMASDLAGTGFSSGGDAHLANFGGVASPLFDLDGFDEALPGTSRPVGVM
jgi:hypothetical protein